MTNQGSTLLSIGCGIVVGYTMLGAALDRIPAAVGATIITCPPTATMFRQSQNASSLSDQGITWHVASYNWDGKQSYPGADITFEFRNAISNTSTNSFRCEYMRRNRSAVVTLYAKLPFDTRFTPYGGWNPTDVPSTFSCETSRTSCSVIINTNSAS